MYRVLKYALKHKQPEPQCRSAFTYSEDELPSHIDFGKSKYGGPFTTEQMEDVKTFLRLIPMTLVGGVLVGRLFTANYLRDKIYEVITIEDQTLQINYAKISLGECYLEADFIDKIYYSSVVLIVLHEVAFYPIFYRCLPQIESLQKLIVGMLLQTIRVMAFILVLHRTTKDQIQCPFNFDSKNGRAIGITFGYYWITIPDILEAISVVMLHIGAAEFLSAQVPQFMKGILIGITYCSLFISGALWFALFKPFTIKNFWGTKIATVSCGFWFSVILAIIEICICLLLIILTRWHKKRRRQDVLPNEHIYAERYYSTI